MLPSDITIDCAPPHWCTMVSHETAMPSALLHDLVITFGLAYFAIGALIWLILDCCAVIETSIDQKRRREGRAVTLPFAVLGSLVMILVWPWFVWIAVKRRKEMWVALKRVVWR